MDQIRVLIADDYEPFRRGLRAMLQSETDITVVGEAADGQGALAEAEARQPDVVLMDLKMPGMNGLEATRRILHTSPHIRVLMLTMADDDESVFAALQVGARGYVLKGALKADVLRAIRGVHSGDAIFGPAVAQRLMHYFATVRPPVLGEAFPELTERERQILGLLAQNRSNQEIADRLVLSVKTVRNHISNICTKLQVADRTQAMLRARDVGLGRG
ncbi:MAG: response regulator transcription factor [Chloroflexota bacterium]|nr:response regulator transcription factor [Chloroflexota bacterium]